MKQVFTKWIISSISLMGTAVLVAGCGTLGSAGTNTNTTASTNSTSTTGSAQNNVQNTSYPLTITDEAGNKVTIPKQPKHIASTTEGTDEILSALVPKKDVAMVTTYATNPAYSNIVAWAKGIPAIQNATAEQVIAVHPDLVLAASYTTKGVVSQIEQTGTPVFEFTNFNSIAGIEQNIQLVGKLVGEQPKANQLVAQMNQKLSSIEKAVQGQKKVTVLDYSSYGFAAGTGTTVNDVIVDGGGINAAAKLQGWQKISTEEIVKMNPQVIIDASDDTGFIQKILTNPALQTVSAVKNHRVYSINSADLTTVSQYVVNGVRDVAKVLYPGVHFNS